MHDPFRRRAVFVQRPLERAFRAAALAALIALAFASLGSAMRGYFALGVALGIATCIPIGIANVIVIDAAHRYGARRAIGASIGGALADGIYASLGIFGVGSMIARSPTLPYVLHIISGCVLLAYGWIVIRSRPAVPENPGPASRAGGGDLANGFVVGVGATLLNPSAIITWVVIVGGHAAGISREEAGAWVAGIVLGTFAWFLVVMALALRGRRILREKAVCMARVVGVLVIGSGVYSLSRVVALAMHGG